MGITPVILCGGSGTRLWPLSRSCYPKQFMDLEGRTLFGDTVDRALALPGSQGLMVVCNQSQRFLAGAHLQNLPEAPRIVLEPEARNTAPAIALAAFIATCGGDDPVLLVLPSDHHIEENDVFAAVVSSALPVAEQGYLVTFGITPTAPATGFGYIRQGKPLPGSDAADPAFAAFTVDAFLEKPEAAKAAAMLDEGGYYWNSGMFLFRASVYLEELARHAPAIHEACRNACTRMEKDKDFIRVDEQAFAHCPQDSIDYAVMEHTTRAALAPLPVHWTDLGSWGAFHETGKEDAQGNVCVGDVHCEESRGCYLHSTHRLLTTVGLEDTVVVETADAVLVAPRDRAQDVKKVVQWLAAGNRPEKDNHVKVYRPWGCYEVLRCEDRFQVKRIIVNPGAVLSRQMHYHRAEHWVVVSGTALVTVNGKATILHENQSTYIELGMEHRLENPGRIPLVVIEIQTGSYLGEDDIVRFEDTYGRA